jgi:hypothetical protein
MCREKERQRIRQAVQPESKNAAMGNGGIMEEEKDGVAK